MIDGSVLGRVTSGGYGYTVGHSIAYAYLPDEHSAPGTECAVEIFGEWVGGGSLASRCTTHPASGCGGRVQRQLRLGRESRSGPAVREAWAG